MRIIRNKQSVQSSLSKFWRETQFDVWDPSVRLVAGQRGCWWLWWEYIDIVMWAECCQCASWRTLHYWVCSLSLRPASQASPHHPPTSSAIKNKNNFKYFEILGISWNSLPRTSLASLFHHPADKRINNKQSNKESFFSLTSHQVWAGHNLLGLWN